MEEFSVKDAAKALGVHADTVRRWVSDGKIVAEKRGKGRGRVLLEKKRRVEMQPFRRCLSQCSNVRCMSEDSFDITDLFRIISRGLLAALNHADSSYWKFSPST